MYIQQKILHQQYLFQLTGILWGIKLTNHKKQIFDRIIQYVSKRSYDSLQYGVIVIGVLLMFHHKQLEDIFIRTHQTVTIRAHDYIQSGIFVSRFYEYFITNSTEHYYLINSNFDKKKTLKLVAKGLMISPKMAF